MFVTRKRVSVSLNAEEQREVRRMVNLTICGHEDCNVLIDGKFESADYVTHEMEMRMLDAHRGISCGHEVELEVSVDENGEFSFKLP